MNTCERNRPQAAFTLVEMLTLISVIAVLMMMIMPLKRRTEVEIPYRKTYSRPRPTIRYGAPPPAMTPEQVQKFDERVLRYQAVPPIPAQP
ncbi:MAG: hypothetical protein V4481_03750 [Patescibacteria group bacterium]